MSQGLGRRGEAVRLAVLEAALEDLGTLGYHGMTMDSVAARAGVHKTTVYRRWPDKDALLADAVLQVTVEPFSIPDSGDVDHDVFVAVQARAEWLTGRHGSPLVAMLAAEGAQSGTVQREVARILAQRRGRIADRLQAAADQGQLPNDVDPDEFLKALLAPIYLGLLVTHEPLTTRMVARTAAIALTAARANLLARTPAAN